MKKIWIAAYLLLAGWLLQPGVAWAALEQIPLPPGSDQLAPLEPDEPVNHNAKKPANGQQKSNALQPLGSKESGDPQSSFKSSTKDAQVAAAGKGGKSAQKKAIKKKSGKKSSKAVHKGSTKKSAKKVKKSGKKAKR
ncbi:MAG: hypothetical protein HQM04_10490 [Magnetococcales bacterium]|nr:hypothetical protein [Magnetococcales bacterium]MBF0115457.1 hypothetical protein [Magnetococcales bacterium]